MNYLAHIYLSGANSRVQIGNFIGDFVKGRQMEGYPPGIRRGIVLHRKIDSFTDSHPVVRHTVSLLRPSFGRYSGIIADMYFDYFLAKRFSDYSRKKSLGRFAIRFYISLLVNYTHLPERVKGFMFHFILTNRLSRYSKLEGMKESLEIMALHKVPAIQPEKTIEFLVRHHDELEDLFRQFFPDVIEYVKKGFD